MLRTTEFHYVSITDYGRRGYATVRVHTTRLPEVKLAAQEMGHNVPWRTRHVRFQLRFSQTVNVSISAYQLTCVGVERRPLHDMREPRACMVRQHRPHCLVVGPPPCG